MQQQTVGPDPGPRDRIETALVVTLGLFLVGVLWLWMLVEATS